MRSDGGGGGGAHVEIDEILEAPNASTDGGGGGYPQAL